MTLRERSVRLLKITITTVALVAGAFTLWMLYSYYTYYPQTRDGKVRADVVSLAADVTGMVDEVMVQDNQVVKKNQLLFTIDRVRLTNDIAEAEAATAIAKAALQSADRESKRYLALTGAVAKQEVDTHRSAAETAQAEYARAKAQLERAKINLERAQVRSPVNGIVTNFSLVPGTYATAGQAVMAIVNQDSYYISGYFEETKLSRIRVGMRATVEIMGESQSLQGHVDGMAAGIEDRERVSTSGGLMANVNPTFSWIRLAQRVPVRIALDKVPDGVTLIAGRTATVVIDDANRSLLAGSGG